MKRISLVLTCLLTSCAQFLSSDFMGPAAHPSAHVHPRKLELIPFEQLEFSVSTENDKIRIRITSKQWRIEGFGTGVSDHEIVIHSVAGTRDLNGGSKEYVYEMVHIRKITVIFSDHNERRHVIK